MLQAKTGIVMSAIASSYHVAISVVIRPIDESKSLILRLLPLLCVISDFPGHIYNICHDRSHLDTCGCLRHTDTDWHTKPVTVCSSCGPWLLGPGKC